MENLREGGVRGAPGGPTSFNFMQLLGKFGKIVCWRPYRVDAPTSEKSWIRHWFTIVNSAFGRRHEPGDHVYSQVNVLEDKNLFCFLLFVFREY